MIQVEANINAMRNEMNGLHNEMNSLRGEMNSLRKEVEARLESIDMRFDAINQRLDSQQTFLFWGFGLLFSFMVFMLGFILWDRRTTLAPVRNEMEVLKQDIAKMK